MHDHLYYGIQRLSIHFSATSCYHQEYITEKEGEYPTSLWACVITLYGAHDLCNDIHMLEASVLAVCGHVAKPQVQVEH